MSLLTRLWLTVATAMLLAFAGALALSIASARDYLDQQLSAQGADGAAGLALSMSQHRVDIASAELLINAMFDSGHFAVIRFRDPGGHVLVERTATAHVPDAPGWFQQLFPLVPRSGSAHVTDGWRQAGSVEVTAASRFAHASLWQSTVRLAHLMLAAVAVVGAILYVLVEWMKHSLAGMVEQAAAIGHGRFVMAAECEVPELRSVSSALNGMVARVGSMFKEQAARIEKLRERAECDELTGLPNRGCFVARLREALHAHAACSAGTLIMVRVDDLPALNRHRGRLEVDEMLRSLAEHLRALTPPNTGAVAARLNGSDFAVLRPGYEAARAGDVLGRLQPSFRLLREGRFSSSACGALVAITAYRRGEAAADVLRRADAALAHAEFPDAEPLMARIKDAAATEQSKS
jgi:diguanylate cyclase (GGDEF)-like protein